MKKLRILFVGNSHTFYNDMPELFRELCEADGETQVEVAMQAHGGVTYGWHYTQKWELRFALLHGRYDYVIYQQAAHSPCPSKEETLADGTAIIQQARAAGVTPIVTIPWAEKRDPAHQLDMYDIYDTLQEKTGVLCSPVGQVFERTSKERPDIDLYWLDGEHCSPYGSYVNACVHYAQILKKSPVGLPAKSFNCITGMLEDMEEVQNLIMAAKELPDEPELMDAAMAEYKTRFQAIMDPESIRVELDPEKAAYLQQTCWEEVQKYNQRFEK